MNPTTQQEIDRLIEQFDPESTFRRLTGFAALFVTVVTVGLSAWHYYTAGFGLENEIAHRAIHLAVVLGLCFLVFPRQKRLPGPWEWVSSLALMAFYLLLGFGLLNALNDPVPLGAQAVFIAVLLSVAALSMPFKAYDGSTTRIPLRDWIFAALASGFSLYLLVNFQTIFIVRPGEHTPIDLMVGVIAIAMVIFIFQLSVFRDVEPQPPPGREEEQVVARRPVPAELSDGPRVRFTGGVRKLHDKGRGLRLWHQKSS